MSFPAVTKVVSKTRRTEMTAVEFRSGRKRKRTAGFDTDRTVVNLRQAERKRSQMADKETRPEPIFTGAYTRKQAEHLKEILAQRLRANF